MMIIIIARLKVTVQRDIYTIKRYISIQLRDRTQQENDILTGDLLNDLSEYFVRQTEEFVCFS